MKSRAGKFVIAILAILLIQLLLLGIHRSLPGYDRFREQAEARGVDMNALFYSEEKHTSGAARALEDKVDREDGDH
ncbi:hypothetical protein [Sinomicrobium oceani]|uniref:hypothetical protein n=1 Tax=Sinomicrobium oceani TaxID=1150368 RepID=UPI00227B4A99|nr:hypothetical protein [Sinomicrobium oceani]